MLLFVFQCVCGNGSGCLLPLSAGVRMQGEQCVDAAAEDIDNLIEDESPTIVRASTWAPGDDASTLTSSSADPRLLRFDSDATDSGEPAEEPPLWLKQATAQLPAALESLELERRQGENLAGQLKKQEEALTEALEDIQILQTERDDLEEVCQQCHVQMHEYESELEGRESDTADGALTVARMEGALAEAHAEQERLRSEGAALKEQLTERDAELLQAAAINARLVQQLADAGLSASIVGTV